MEPFAGEGTDPPEVETGDAFEIRTPCEFALSTERSHAMESMIEKRPEQNLDAAERTRGGLTFVPYADICESEKELTIEMDVPGVAADGLDVNFVS